MLDKSVGFSCPEKGLTSRRQKFLREETEFVFVGAIAGFYPVVTAAASSLDSMLLRHGSISIILM